MKKRKVPILQISLTANASYNEICDVPEFKDILMSETLIAIKEAVNSNKKYIDLFEISDSRKCIGFERKDWKGPLNKVMNHYSELEDYDKAIECRELIKKISMHE